MRSKKSIIKYGIIGFVSLIILVILGIIVFVHTRKPALSGTLYSAALGDKVTVIRDTWGVPHITAASGKDAYFAYGFTIAQDRLFQMEIQRRLAKGELAEILGPSVMKYDRMFRILLMRFMAEKYLQNEKNIDPEALTLMDSFLAGVNRYQETGPLPVEFALLKIKPKPFTRLDCIAIMGYIAFSFADGIEQDSLYSILKEKLPDRNIRELFAGYTRDDDISIMESQPWYRPGTGDKTTVHPDGSRRDHAESADDPDRGIDYSLKGKLAMLSKIREALDLYPVFEGSNSWIIAPSRSASGKAILANDPHIALSNPGVWYEAHIKYGDYENYGYHFPLIPFPMMGHGREKAWGITMFENDDMDLYYETFHPKDKERVMYRGRWEKVKTLKETIRVKGQPDEVLEIKITPHGPVITTLLENYKGKPVSLFWVFLREQNPMLDIFYRTGKARTLKEFETAIAPLAAPGLNFSYADREGNIAWWGAGKIVIRPPHVFSFEVLDGGSGRDEPQGYLPFAANPRLINPPCGIIVTANNKATRNPVGPFREMEGYWRPTDRAGRIIELLSSKPKWSAEELKEVQTDVKSYGAERVLPVLMDIFKDENPDVVKFTRREKRALGLLRAWDRSYDVTSRGATVYHFLTHYILKEALEDEMGPELFVRYAGLSVHWHFFKAFIKNEKSSYWDDVRTPRKEGRDEIVTRAFRAAVREIIKRYGTGEEGWAWGNVHRIEYVHPIGMKKPMNLLFNIGPLAAPGESHVINRMKSHFGKLDFKISSVPSTRRLVDYGDLGRCYTILPSGNSGILTNRHYDDQAAMYLRGEYRVVNFTDEQVRKDARETMVFLPVKPK